MWMQPAPAHHLGPVRMGLREPVETYPLCRVASHAFHEKAVNNNLKFTSTFFRKGLCFNEVKKDSPRLPWGTGGEKPPEGVWGRT